MTKQKTTGTENSVTDFINTIIEETRRNESFHLIELITNLTGYPSKMWESSIIGFGILHYKYSSGHEGDTTLFGFSPRRDAFSLYFCTGFKRKDELLPKLIKYKAGKSCAYIKKLEDIYIY